MSSPRARRHLTTRTLSSHLSSLRTGWGATAAAAVAIASIVGTTAYYYYLNHHKLPKLDEEEERRRAGEQGGGEPAVGGGQQRTEGRTLSNSVVAKAKALWSGTYVITISMKNVIVWNPSPDPTTPNHAFRESALPYLQHLVSHSKPRFQIHLITVVSSDEEEAQIRSLLASTTLYADGLDERRVLYCATEEGKAHLVRHIEPHVHVDENDDVIERLAPFVKRVVRVRRSVPSGCPSPAMGRPPTIVNGAAVPAARTASAPGASSGIAVDHHLMHQLHPHHATNHHPHHLPSHLHAPFTPSPLSPRRSSSASSASIASDSTLSRTPTLTKLDSGADLLSATSTPPPLPLPAPALSSSSSSSPPTPSPLSPAASSTALLPTRNQHQHHPLPPLLDESPAARIARKYPNVDFVESFAQAHIIETLRSHR